jgi:hypothetical protein
MVCAAIWDARMSRFKFCWYCLIIVSCRQLVQRQELARVAEHWGPDKRDGDL